MVSHFTKEPSLIQHHWFVGFINSQVKISITSTLKSRLSSWNSMYTNYFLTAKNVKRGFVFYGHFIESTWLQHLRTPLTLELFFMPFKMTALS